MDTKYLRNPYATHAHNRKAGPLKHRNAPRGGARNTHSEFLQDASDDALLSGFTDELEDF
jgi:hypothetical protein